MPHALCDLLEPAFLLLYTLRQAQGERKKESPHQKRERSPVIKKILIVDDEKIFLHSLLDCLTTSNYKFHTLIAENGHKALSVLKSEDVDLVVTDLKMPGMDGFEFISHIRKSHPGIPVIVMSAYLNPDVERRLRSNGITKCIEKPLELGELVHLILGGLDDNFSKSCAKNL